MGKPAGFFLAESAASAEERSFSESSSTTSSSLHIALRERCGATWITPLFTSLRRKERSHVDHPPYARRSAERSGATWITPLMHVAAPKRAERGGSPLSAAVGPR